VSVSTLQQEDAELLLWRYSGRESTADSTVAVGNVDPGVTMEEQEAVRWLAGSEGLDGLPLLLRQAGCYVRENRCSFVEYKELYDAECTRVFEAADADPTRAVYASLQGVQLHSFAEKLRVEIGVHSLQNLQEAEDEDLKEVGIDKAREEALPACSGGRRGDTQADDDGIYSKHMVSVSGS
jgi:hypothetical protein